MSQMLHGPAGELFQEATNGKEALDKVATQHFDIVLLDVHMPVMDGKECIQRIRASTQPWASWMFLCWTSTALRTTSL